MKRSLPLTLTVISAVLTLLLALLTNLVSGYISDALKPYAPWLFAALIAVFLVSLIVLIWQQRIQPPTAPTGPVVEQSATNGGRIDHSPIQVPNSPGVSATQEAKDNGVIRDSGITIT